MIFFAVHCKNFLFFDEIQRVEHFEEVVDSFFINPLLDIYITGSNSRILSGELATYLSGRYVEIQMQPHTGIFLYGRTYRNACRDDFQQNRNQTQHGAEHEINFD